MSNCWTSSSPGSVKVSDRESLELMLEYVVSEAERLGLRQCEHYAALARDACATRSDPQGGRLC